MTFFHCKTDKTHNTGNIFPARQEEWVLSNVKIYSFLSNDQGRGILRNRAAMSKTRARTEEGKEGAGGGQRLRRHERKLFFSRALLMTNTFFFQVPMSKKYSD